MLDASNKERILVFIFISFNYFIPSAKWSTRNYKAADSGEFRQQFRG